MIPRPLEKIEASDIASLIEGSEAEHKTREYKRELPGTSPADKDKLRANATSLANTAGGDMIFGIDEVDEAPVLTGIGDASEDEAVRHILGTLQYNIEPKLAPPPHTLVTMPGGERVLIVRVARSWRGPHFVKNNDNYRMYGRHSKGRFPMDASEMRQAIVGSEELPERIRRWRMERIDRILAFDAPATLYPGSTVVLHVKPWQSFQDEYRLTASELSGESVQFMLIPMVSSGWDDRINLDGVLRYNSDTGTYCQSYRSGCIEFVRSRGVGRNSPTIPGGSFERMILETLGRAFQALSLLRVDGPFSVMLSLLNVRGLGMAHERLDPEFASPVDRDHLVLPDVLIESWPTDLYAAMRPVFDAVWNACGQPRSLNYDEEGKWVGAKVQGLPDP